MVTEDVVHIKKVYRSVMQQKLSGGVMQEENVVHGCDCKSRKVVCGCYARIKKLSEGVITREEKLSVCVIQE
jgi:hypothetical protein